MGETIIEWINYITGIMWGPAMLFLLVGGGVYLTLRLGFIQLSKFGFMLDTTVLSFFKKKEGEEKSGGTISAFQALTSELASTVGASNIVGVPVAIYFGGPGAIFWMWVTALVGMATKYSEVVLGVHYREKNSKGEYVGGPMYYLKKGLPKGLQFLGPLFAFFLMMEVFAGVMVQANSAAGSAMSLGIPVEATGVVVTLMVAAIVIGGVSRIGQISEKFVPIMSGLYMLGAFVIIGANITSMPAVIGSIFTSAFSGHAAAGGFAGSAIAATIRWGVARGAFSNEAGMGTSPIAHAAAVTDHPARQGMWAMFSVFFDTIVLCTTTALVILSTGIWKTTSDVKASAMTAEAFNQFFGPIGGTIVSISVLLFVVSTIYVIIFFGEKLAESLFGYKFSVVARYLYIACIFLGAIGAMKTIWVVVDLLFGLAIIPNMIGVLLMAGKVKDITNDFFQNKLGKEDKVA